MVESVSGALARRGVDLHVVGIQDEAWDRGDDAAWGGAPARTATYYGPSAFGFAPGLDKHLHAIQPDLIHLHGLWMWSSAVALRWVNRRAARLVISPHGGLAHRALAYSRLKKSVVRIAFQNQCFNAASAYHATAEREALDIHQALGPVPVSVIPNGIDDIDIEMIDWADRPRRVVALGRLHPIKGYPLLLQSWSRIEAHFPDWELEIAGPDQDGHSNVLQRLAANIGLQRVVIGPPRYGPERYVFMMSSRLFALPSESENFALTVLESLVCETPVIASTGTPWQALQTEGCGWWVAPEVESFANALAQAMSLQDKKLAAMGRKGRAWALEQFGWDRIAAEFEALYAKVMSSPLGR